MQMLRPQPHKTPRKRDTLCEGTMESNLPLVRAHTDKVNWNLITKTSHLEAFKTFTTRTTHAQHIPRHIGKDTRSDNKDYK